MKEDEAPAPPGPEAKGQGFPAMKRKPSHQRLCFGRPPAGGHALSPRPNAGVAMRALMKPASRPCRARRPKHAGVFHQVAHARIFLY